MANEQRNITKADLNRKPPAERTNIADTQCKGLVLRLTPLGTKSWAFYYWDRQLQKTCWITFDEPVMLSLDAARSKADKLRAVVRDGTSLSQEAVRAKVLMQPRIGGMLFADLYTVYIEYIRSDAIENPDGTTGKKSWGDIQSLLQRPLALWGRLLASSITDDMVVQLLESVAKEKKANGKGKKVTANRMQSALYVMFKWAKQPGRKYVTINPLADLDRVGGREFGRERVLSEKEIKTLWWGLDDPKLPCTRRLALAYKLILTTMLRPGETIGMLKSEINETKDGRVVEIASTRVKKMRPIVQPLNSLAGKIVDELLSDPKLEDALFYGRTPAAPMIPAHLSRMLSGTEFHDSVAEYLGIAPFTPHDLRRTASTIVNGSGADVNNLNLYVEKALDHLAGSAVGARYNRHQYVPEKRIVLNVLDRELRRIIGKSPAKLKLVA